MTAYLKYLSYVLRHKWFVFIECCKLGIPWQGIIHDISKFLPGEFIPYARYFYGKWMKEAEWHGDVRNYVPWKYTEMGVKAALDKAWLLHQKRNPHHWQFWILKYDSDGIKILAMPDKYRKEMLADWIGAGKAQGKPDTKAWYEANKDKMQFHPETRKWIETMLGVRP